MLDRLTGLRVFTEVEASGSLSAAGRALGMSQTMVTKHIAALEGRLGVKLFHRSTRRISLTDAGRNYLESAERILADIEAADSAVAADRVEPRGLLRVNAPVSFGCRQIAPLLPEFARAYPLVTVELGLNDRYVDLVEEGWDLAIRIGNLSDSRLIARRIASCRTIVCAAPSYFAAHGVPRTLSDLAGHNCLGYTLVRSGGPGKWMFGPKGDIAVAVTGQLRANNGDALCAAAVAGQGVIYQPTFIVADDLRRGTLVAPGLDQPMQELDGVYTVYPPERHPAAKLRVFIDFLASHFGPEPPWDRDIAAGQRVRTKADSPAPLRSKRKGLLKGS